MSESAHQDAASSEMTPPAIGGTDNSRTQVVASQSSAPVPSDKPVVPVESALWLRRSDQLIVGLLIAALLVLLGIQWLRLSRWGYEPVELTSQQPREYHYSLDINKASWVEWAQLEGIGQKLARRIVEDRDERGPFRNPADVGRVRGIGPKVLEKLMPFLRGGTDPAPDRST